MRESLFPSASALMSLLKENFWWWIVKSFFTFFSAGSADIKPLVLACSFYAGKMLKGRLGLESANIPHGDRHGLLWLERGNLYVEDGTLHFLAAKTEERKGGDYVIAFQDVSIVLLGPGTAVSHDALRLLARHGTSLVAVGEGGTRLYTAPPLGPNESPLAKRQAEYWADEKKKLGVVLKMYRWRMGEDLGVYDINALRGIEGARMKETYVQLARKYGVAWKGRRYDRSQPEAADLPNQAINHAATAVEAAATIAVVATGTIPQLGFIHEQSTNAFCLDISDLYRDEMVLPIAFQSVRLFQEQPEVVLERHVRRLASRRFKETKLIPRMIERIKELFAA